MMVFSIQGGYYEIALSTFVPYYRNHKLQVNSHFFSGRTEGMIKFQSKIPFILNDAVQFERFDVSRTFSQKTA